MVDYKPKIKNVYNTLVQEFISKASDEPIKVNVYVDKQFNKNIDEHMVKIVNYNNMVVSRRNRNYNETLILHNSDEEE